MGGGADVARHVEAHAVGAEVAGVEPAGGREPVLGQQLLGRRDGRPVLGVGLDPHVVEVGRRVAVVAGEAPDEAEFPGPQHHLHVGAARGQQVADDVRAAHVPGVRVEHEVPALPGGVVQVGRVAAGGGADTPDGEDTRRVRAQVLVRIEVEGEEGPVQGLVRPGHGRREHDVVQVLLGSRQAAGGVDDVAVGPVAPVDARRAAGAGHHHAVVDEDHLVGGVGRAGIEIRQVVQEMGEVAHAGRTRGGERTQGAVLEVDRGAGAVVQADHHVVQLHRAARRVQAVLVGEGQIAGHAELDHHLVAEVTHVVGGLVHAGPGHSQAGGDAIAAPQVVPAGGGQHAQVAEVVARFGVVVEHRAHVDAAGQPGRRHRAAPLEHGFPVVAVAADGVGAAAGRQRGVPAPGRVDAA